MQHQRKYQSELNVYSENLLLCSSLFRMVRFWRIDEEYPVQVAPLNNGLCCTFSTDGSVLAAGQVYTFFFLPKILR